MALFQKLSKWGKESIRCPRIGNVAATQPNNLFTIPHHRIDEHKRISQQLGKPFFTSDLSTNEYLLTREAGYEAVGMVMGTSFYKVGFYGYFRGYRTQTGEVEALTQAQLASRELAVSRMQQEAALLGAHGIIGVRLQQRRKGWGIGMVEFTAIGTAIRMVGRPPESKPFTSDLSGQEFWQLRQAGYYPKALVFGACSYYIHSDRATRALMNQSSWNRLFGQGRRNQELTQFTQGFQNARELAVMRLTEDIQQAGATGAVGINIKTSQEVINYRPWSFSSWLISLFFFGFFIALFIALITGQTSFAVLLLSIVIPAISAIIPLIIVFSILSSFWNAGPYRDLLINFVAIGTAIVEDKIPTENSISKTLIFYPLSKM